MGQGITEKQLGNFVDIVAAFASLAGYAGLFTMIECTNFDLSSNWWALALAVASLLPIAIIPFLFISKRWPDKMFARWFVSSVWTLGLVWVAFWVAPHLPGSC